MYARKAGAGYISGVVEALMQESIRARTPTIHHQPVWEQFSALLPERKTDHPLGCHRRRIPDRVVFEKLVEVLVFGCAYWDR